MRTYSYLFAACLCSVLSVASPALAMTTYQYLGNTYHTIQDDVLPPGTYTTDMRISGRITVENPLEDGFYFLDDIAADSYWFSDGRAVKNDSNSNFSGNSYLIVEAGEVVEWTVQFSIVQDLFPQVGDTNITIYSDSTLADFGALTTCAEYAPGSYDCLQPMKDEAFATPGSWSVVPLPGASWLLGSALGSLVWMRRKIA